MNGSQRLWWEQAKSDHEMYLLLRREGTAQCHTLHYLQMAAEKIAKAYLWRDAVPPKKHIGFARFLSSLCQTRSANRERVAGIFASKSVDSFKSRIRSVATIAHELERLAPSLAGDGPNPEYPWPHANPIAAPVNHTFSVSRDFESSRGRDLLRIIETAVNRFDEYAD